MNEIDKKDLRIISSLDMTARTPLNALAKKVQLKREVIEYRMKRLAQRGVVTGAHTVFDLDVIGFRSFRLLLRLFNLGNDKKAELIEDLVAHPHTWWVASTGGRWDIIMNFVAKDPAEFNELFEDLITKYGDCFQDYEILIYIDIHDFPRNYILDQKRNESMFYHPMRFKPEVKIDKIDIEIMKKVSENALISYTDIGSEVNLTRNAVKERIKLLEKQGLILGYRLTYHPSKLGYSSYMLLLNINNLKKDREKQLIEFAKVNGSIIFVVKHVGKYRITFECEVTDEKAFHQLLSQVRDKFNDILIDFDFFPIFYDHKIAYLPSKLLEKMK